MKLAPQITTHAVLLVLKTVHKQFDICSIILDLSLHVLIMLLRDLLMCCRSHVQ